ncbi:MAG: hypothetical protein U0353_07440 [Sandaracinus sp.]
MARMQSFVEGGCWVIQTSERLRFELHWSLPLFPIFTRCATPISFALALVVLAVHEVGHAIVVRWRGLETYAIRMHGMGGHCLHEGGRPLDEAWIAWGGVLAQLPFFVVGVALTSYLPPGRIADDLWVSLVLANGMMIAFNLVPIRGLDGWKAWSLFRLLRTDRAATKARADRWAEKDRAMWDTIEAAKKRQAERDRQNLH